MCPAFPRSLGNKAGDLGPMNFPFAWMAAPACANRSVKSEPGSFRPPAPPSPPRQEVVPGRPAPSSGQNNTRQPPRPAHTPRPLRGEGALGAVCGLRPMGSHPAGPGCLLRPHLRKTSAHRGGRDPGLGECLVPWEPWCPADLSTLLTTSLLAPGPPARQFPGWSL